MRERRNRASLASLSLAAGCPDVLSFLMLGTVFTSAMTGTAALLAIAIGRGDMAAARLTLCALAAFSLGVAIGTTLGGELEGSRRAFRKLLGFELAVLCACAALWSTGPDPLQ